MLEIEDDILKADDGYTVGTGKRKRREIQPKQAATVDDDFCFDPKNDFNSFLQKKEEDQGILDRFTDSWVLMALLAMLSFACANLLINEISPLGIDAIDYYNTGALVWCSGYLLMLQQKKRKRFNVRQSQGGSENMLYEITIKEYRDLLYTRAGSFDPRVVVLIISASFLTIAMFISVSFTYALAGQEGLNIGLAQTVWGTTPFFGALMDWYINNIRVPSFQIVGMFCMVICVSLISFQGLIFGQAETVLGIDGVAIPENTDQPVITVFIFALTYCVIMALLVMVQKQATVIIKVNPMDFVTAYFFLTMLCAQLYGLYSFWIAERAFSWHFFWIGSSASLLNLLGQYFQNMAVATENPIGPIQAVLSSQAILITFIQVLQFNHPVTSVQLIAFVIGMIGAFILVIPDQIKSLVTCCFT